MAARGTRIAEFSAYLGRRGLVLSSTKRTASGAVLQTPGGDARFGEMTLLYVWRNNLSEPIDCDRRRQTAVDVVGTSAGDALVRPPGVVPNAEGLAEIGQVTGAADDRHAAEPFVLEELDQPLGYRDRSVLADGTEMMANAAVGK